MSFGHWYEIPNMIRNGTLARLFEARPRLKYLMVHNIDTMGADVDAGLPGYHIEQGATSMYALLSSLIRFLVWPGHSRQIPWRIRLLLHTTEPSLFCGAGHVSGLLVRAIVDSGAS